MILASAFVLLTAAMLTVKYLPPYLHARRVAGLIEEFQASPCQQTADPLIELLVNSKVSQKTGDRVLEMLLSPKVTTKDSYAIGEKIRIDIATAFSVKVSSMEGSVESLLYVEGITEGDGHPGSDSLVIAPNLSCLRGRGLSLWSPPLEIRQPGVYPGHVRITYALGEDWLTALLGPLQKQLSTTGKILALLGFRQHRPHQSKVYQCRHKIPITIRVVGSASSPASTVSRPAGAGG